MHLYLIFFTFRLRLLNYNVDYNYWRHIFTFNLPSYHNCWITMLLKTHLSDYDAASSPPWFTLPSSPWVFSLFHNIGINIFTFIWRIHFFNIFIFFCTWFRLITNVITITRCPENCTWLIQEFSQKHPCHHFDGQIPGDRADHPLCVLAPWNSRSTGCFFLKLLVQLILILLY